MLHLGRSANQTIRIGENIEIHVIRIDRGYVKLGIKAPRDVPVLRGELELKSDDDGEPLAVDLSQHGTRLPIV